MPSINIKFKECKDFTIVLFENSVTNRYLPLLEHNLERSLPIFRDPGKYTETYLQTLCKEVKQKLNWNWLGQEYSVENTVRFHKDIEKLLDKQGDFGKLDGDIQNLIHEAHFCIHALQYKNPKYKHGFAIHLEWFNDDYVDLPNDAKLRTDIDFGDVILQNAYVGHPPIQCYQQNDYEQIERTCAFPDRIKPGIKINLMPKNKNEFDWQKYEQWWKEKCCAFVDKVGMEQIRYYTGFTKIGHVQDIDLFSSILGKDVLEVESVTIL